MAFSAAPAPAPSLTEVETIAALGDPIRRNLRLTECYHRLSASFAARTGEHANWCTFATWASRQAGSTIRGEDVLSRLESISRAGDGILHPVRAAWRALLRRGLFYPRTRLGRLVHEIHSPFDAVERASDAVARGNLKVFAEIGAVFARSLAGESVSDTLRVGEPPGGQGLLRSAFRLYQQAAGEPDAVRRAQLVLLANLEIGLHEQTRLQPEIQEAMETAPETAEDLGRRALAVLFPRAAESVLARPLGAALGPPARGFRRFVNDLTRRIVTSCLMTLTLPGPLVLELGRDPCREFPPPLKELSEPDLAALAARFEPAGPSPDRSGAADWSQLPQRMHYILHLFRAFQLEASLFKPPFTPEQTASILAGGIPGGGL